MHRTPAGEEEEAQAPCVFGNAAPAALAELLPADQRSAFLAPYAGRTPSISLWTISIGLRRPAREFGVLRYSTFVFPAWMKALAELREVSAIIGDPAEDRLL